MKKVILGLIAFSAIAASAASLRLGSATLDQDENSATIDVRNTAQVSEVLLTVTSGAASIGEVKVVYRTGNGFGKYVSTKYKLNTYVAKGGSVALDIPANGYAIRRIEIQGHAAGLTGDAYITATGK